MPDTGERKRLRAKVRGVVQGVGFRAFVAREARRIGVTGWVRNLSDGSVAVDAEGREPQLRELQRSLRAGPPGASVERVEAEWLAPDGGARGFEITYRPPGP